MTQHIMTNGNQIFGTAGNVQMTSDVAGRVLCNDVRHRVPVVHCVDGKRLSKSVRRTETVTIVFGRVIRFV